jgi:hypothetical protein
MRATYLRVGRGARPKGEWSIGAPERLGSLSLAVKPHEATIQRVVDLLVRLDSRRTEIAASAHFAAGILASEFGRRPSEREVLERVQRWKQRRRPPLAEPEIVIAIRDLAALGWIEVTRSADLPPTDEMVTVA